MSFVTHLCFRLIDLGKDGRAVRKIQRAWQVSTLNPLGLKPS